MEITVGILLHNVTAADIEQFAKRCSIAAKRAEDAIAASGDYVHFSFRAIDGHNAPASLAPLVERDWFIEKGDPGASCYAEHNRLMQSAFGEGASHYIITSANGFPHPDCFVGLVTAARGPAGMVEALQFPVEHPKPWDPLTGDTPWCTLACTLISEAAYGHTGGFDTNFFMHHGEVDLSWRLKSIGLPLRVIPKALVFQKPVTSDLPHVRRSQLVSGKYLARKWRSAGFEGYIDRLLVDEGFFPAPEYFPPTPEPPHYFSEAWPAEFRQMFHFAIPRWE